ncbi:MAG: succinate dehydrogenase, cytochrome b556 subunit [Fidelibacterota bacterium]
MRTNTFSEIKLNFNWGMISYIFHRVTGIALSLYLFLHIWTLSAVRNGREAFEHSLSKWDNIFGHTLEYLLLIAVTIHLLNGLRITVSDFFDLSRIQKKMLGWAVVLLIALALYSISFIFHFD